MGRIAAFAAGSLIGYSAGYGGWPVDCPVAGTIELSGQEPGEDAG